MTILEVVFLVSAGVALPPPLEIALPPAQALEPGQQVAATEQMPKLPVPALQPSAHEPPKPDAFGKAEHTITRDLVNQTVTVSLVKTLRGAGAEEKQNVEPNLDDSAMLKDAATA